MATKPMPRLRAGISGSPLITPTKRSLSLHVKSKPHSNRIPNRHAGTGGLRKEATLHVKKLVLPDDASTCGEPSIETRQFSEVGPDSTETQSSTWETMCRQIDVQSDSPDLERIGLNFEKNLDGSAEQDSEVARLKQLMLLQISLISRQQDLLKLRDKEVMQLKTKTQSYKSRLERMERRIMLSRRHSDVDSYNHERRGKSLRKSGLGINNVKESKEMDTDSPHSSTEDEHHPGGDCSLPVTSSLNKGEKHLVDLHQESRIKPFTPTSKFRSPTADDSLFTSPVSLVHSAYAASGCIPVPVSFVDRFKNDLPSPVARDHAGSQPVVVKVCDHCPHCSSMVSEMKKELPLSGMVHTAPTVVTESSQSSISRPLDDNDLVVPATSASDDVVVEANHPYHLITWPRDDQLYPYTDFEFSFDEGSTLNIPRWKVNKLVPLSSGVQAAVKESVDDETFFKRHSRLEIAEKRRKRWDIQRIREFRYNEKLRQKHLKQGNEQYMFETFSPSLAEITDLQVDETLPVNIFGHLLQPLQRGEFSLHNYL